jgi:hypothetical protein
MALFALEALEARSGDALMVHFGTAADPRLMLVDGGFATTYSDVLRPRLDAIRASRDPNLEQPLLIDHVVVSHIDDDHITGIVRLCRELRDAAQQGDPPRYAIGRMWHNAFRDSLAQLTQEVPAPRPVVDQGEARASGVAAGRELRDSVEFLGRESNPPFNGFVVGPRRVDLGHGLSATVVGPSQKELDELRREWREHVQPRIERGEIAEAAAFVDNSATNLSSIVIHLRQGDRAMVLTGDGRGDHTLQGLESGGLLDAGGQLEVDVLKLPHHGSDRDVDRIYFERIVADHYVISANGANSNPSELTLRLLVETQAERAYTIHLTNEVRHAIDFLTRDRADHKRNYTVDVRDPGNPSVVATLEGDPP